MSLKSNIKRAAPAFLLSLGRQVVRPYRKALEIGDALGVLPPDAIYGDSWYANMDTEIARRDAKAVADTLYQQFEPESAIDFGCGVGLHLRALKAHGVSVHGLEGAEAALRYSVLDDGEMELQDLREPYSPSQTYDLAICFEVAEHLPARYADTLVSTVTDAAPIVAFTAATPGQGGTHHMNEQPHEYWIEKFENQGYTFQSDQTESIREEISVEKTEWIPQNLMIFST